jgi:hypothetical protein
MIIQCICIIISIIIIIILCEEKQYEEHFISNIPIKTKYTNPQNSKVFKIIRLKCKFDGQNYYLAITDKSKINNDITKVVNCNNDIATIKDKILILVRESNIVDKNCYKNEMIKCFNSGSNFGVTECHELSTRPNYCDLNKVDSTDTEFIILRNDSNDLLSSNFIIVNKEQIALTIREIVDPMLSLPDNCIVCIAPLNSSQLEYQLINLDQIDSTNTYDKETFKIYFNVKNDKMDTNKGTSKRYLGIENNINPKYSFGSTYCDPKNPECVNNFKTISLYTEDSKNLLIFEAEIVDIKKY